MATLEERVQAIREARENPAVPRVSLEDRVAAVREAREAAPVEPEVAIPQTTVAPPVAPAPVDPDSASSAIGRGVDQMQAALGGALETAGEITGSEFLRDAGASYREEQQAEAAQYGTPSISSYKQVDIDNPETIALYLKQLGLGGLPSIGVGVGGAIAGGKAGAAIGGGRGAITGGILGALGSALPLNIGEVQNAIKEIDPEMQSPWASVLGGTAMSTLDVVGLSSIAKPLIKTFGKDLAYDALVQQGVAKEAAVGAIKGALVEAPTEAAQEGIKALSAAEGTDTKVNVEKLIEDSINAAIGGGMLGGGAGGTVGALGASSQNQVAPGSASPGANFESGRQKPLNMAQRAWDAIGSSSTALLEPVARVSPSMEGIIRKFRPDMTGEKATAPTIFEDADLMVGKWTSEMEQGLRGKDVDQAISDYLNDVVTPESTVIKNTLGDVLNVAKKEGGLDIGQIKNYLPTRLDADQIAANPAQFLQDIAPYVKDPQAALDNWLLQQGQDRGNTVPRVERGIQMDALGNWVASPQYQRSKDPESFRYKFAQGTVPPEFGHLEKSRAFGSVPQAVLQKYTKEQSTGEIMSALRDYFEGAAHRIAFSKAFGPQGEKLNFEVVKGVKEAQTKGYQPTKQEVDRVYDLLDAYNGMYHRIQSEGLKDTISVVSAVATMKALPLTVLSSLVEVAAPAIRGDIKSALLEIAPTIGQVIRDSARAILKGIPRNEVSKFASEANITLQSSMNVAAERLGTDIFNRGSAKALRLYFLGTGLTLWTQMLSTYSVRVADRVFHDNLQKLAGGLPVSSARGAQAAAQLRSLGVPVFTNADAEILYNPQSFSQRATSDQFRKLALRRFKDQTILEPNIADTPMWMSNGHLQMFALLNRYPAAFGNIILPALARKFQPSWAGSRSNAYSGAVGAVFLLGFMLSVGYLQDEMKLVAKNGELGGEDTRTEAQRFVDVLNTTIAPPQVSRLLDFVAAPRYGTSGVDTLAGPAVGMATDLAKTINSIYDNPGEGEIWKYLFRQTPAQFYRPGREAAEDFEIFD